MLYEFDNLDKLIDEKSRNRVIKKIFCGDSDDYSNFIESLKEIETWEDAFKFMEDEFQKRNININNNRIAAAFTDIVFKKYYPIYFF